MKSESGLTYFPKGPATPPDIHRDIKDSSGKDLDELALRFGVLLIV